MLAAHAVGEVSLTDLILIHALVAAQDDVVQARLVDNGSLLLAAHAVGEVSLTHLI